MAKMSNAQEVADKYIKALREKLVNNPPGEHWFEQIHYFTRKTAEWLETRERFGVEPGPRPKMSQEPMSADEWERFKAHFE